MLNGAEQVLLLENKYIATNHHVVKDAGKIEIVGNFNGKKVSYQAEVVASDATKESKKRKR
jgi:S1-C subfamily serine protease